MKYKHLKVYCFTILLILLNINKGFNQVSYTPLKSCGNIPDDFLMSSTKKIDNDIKEDYQKTKVPITISKKIFFELSNFLIDDLLLSGNILFGDTVTNYVRSVAAKLYKNDPFLLNNIRIYTVKSSDINAFTTNSGIIFVTLGLISFVENESQLAYILSHEAIHYKNKHVIESFQNNNNLFTSNDYKGLSIQEKIYLASQYSKSLEIEADSLGLIMFLKSGYDKSEIIPFLENYKINKPFYHNDNFTENFLSIESLKIPNYYYDKPNDINLINVYSKAKIQETGIETHPTFDSRINQIKRMLVVEEKNVESKKNQLSKEFEYIQLRSRMEFVRILIAELDYTRAIYESFMLSKIYPNENYFKISIMKSLYGITKFIEQKNYSIIYEVNKSENKSFEKFISLLSNCGGKEINLLSAHYLYVNSVHLNNKFVKSLRDELFIDLINKYNVDFVELRKNNDSLKLDYYNYLIQKIELEVYAKNKELEYNNKKDSLINSLDENKIDSILSLKPINKKEEPPVFNSDPIYVRKKNNDIKGKYNIDLYDKSSIKFDKTLNFTSDLEKYEKENFKQYFKIIFSDLITDSNFITYIDSLIKIAALKKENDTIKFDFDIENPTVFKSAQAPKISLGIKNLIISSPYYFRFYNDKILVKDSEIKQKELVGYIESSTKKLSINKTQYFSKGFSKKDVENYNDHANLNIWLQERLMINNVKMTSLETEYIEYLIEKSGTSFVHFSGCIQYRLPNYLARYLASTIFLIPIAIICLAVNTNSIIYSNAVFDLKTGNCYLYTEEHFKANKANIMNGVYNNYNRIKSK